MAAAAAASSVSGNTGGREAGTAHRTYPLYQSSACRTDTVLYRTWSPGAHCTLTSLIRSGLASPRTVRLVPTYLESPIFSFVFNSSPPHLAPTRRPPSRLDAAQRNARKPR
jgi:hypothetical protein